MDNSPLYTRLKWTILYFMHDRSKTFRRAVLEALEKKIVFVAGPRQVGKTTFSLSLLGSSATEQHPAYRNWDRPQVAKELRDGKLPSNQKLIVLDEIHKYARWRNLIKGFYDTEKSRHQFLVTGSARLDYYRKGGDSLVNRYRLFRLHPFSLMEMSKDPSDQDLQDLLKFSGFPEPLFSRSESDWRIWQRDRVSRVVREDLRDLEQVREISLIEALVELLPSKVGSPLSIKSLREDLNVDHKTVERWVHALENLYLCFRIAPFGAPKVRAVKKEKKLYLWDWSMVPDAGPRFENLVASQLLKYCHWIEDTEGRVMELRFLRDSMKREVDFVVIQDKKPIFAVECKTGDVAVSPALRYFSERTPIPKYFQVHQRTADFSTGKIRVLPFIQFCKEMDMP